MEKCLTAGALERALWVGPELCADCEGAVAALPLSCRFGVGIPPQPRVQPLLRHGERIIGIIPGPVSFCHPNACPAQDAVSTWYFRTCACRPGATWLGGWGRGTVRAAYEALIDVQLIVALGAAGTFVGAIWRLQRRHLPQRLRRRVR